MTAEDFAYFTEKYPAVFYRLGIRNKQNAPAPELHTARFTVDDHALLTGMGTMAFIAASMGMKGLTK